MKYYDHQMQLAESSEIIPETLPCGCCKPYRDYISKFEPSRNEQCILNKPLYMVIPPNGIHLGCPIHPEGHHIYGQQIAC